MALIFSMSPQVNLIENVRLLALSCFLVSTAFATVKMDHKPELSVNLTVDRKVICAEHGEAVHVHCRLTIMNVNVSAALYPKSTLSWNDEAGRRLHAWYETKTVDANSSMLTLTSGLRVYANWSTTEGALFTCSARGRLSEGGNITWNNETVIVGIKPRPVTVIGLRFSETARGKIVETFWKPLIDDSASVVYMLKYCVTAERRECLCPSYAKAGKCECRFRERDYHSVANTSGFVCAASFSFGHTALLLIEHRVYVSTQRMFCESKGPVREFDLDTSPDDITNIDTSTLYLVPHPVINLNVSVTKPRVVHLSWADPGFVYETCRKYIVDYNCSTNATVWTRETPTTKISLNSVDFRPYRAYALCQFCVKARLSEYGVPSESVCTTARLHEEVPSGSPRFTCEGRACETTSDGIERNVTVTWALPPREDWNGKLEKVKLIYELGHEVDDRRQIEVSESNLTKGETALERLAVNSSYVIRMVACNNEGCSESGNAMTLPSLPAAAVSAVPSPTATDKNGGINSKVTIGLLSVAVILVIGCFVLGGVWVRRRRRALREPLPAVRESTIYGNVGDIDAGEENYDHI